MPGGPTLQQMADQAKAQHAHSVQWWTRYVKESHPSQIARQARNMPDEAINLAVKLHGPKVLIDRRRR